MKLRTIEAGIRSIRVYSKLVTRLNNVAIFSQSKDGHEHFEVVRVKVRKPNPNYPNPDGADLAEGYPASEDWGTLGFTYRTLTEAETRAARLYAARLP